MLITINGKTKEATGPCSLKEYIESEQIDIEWCAIAVNGAFVPKQHHSSTYLSNGDEIEILQPAQGG